MNDQRITNEPLGVPLVPRVGLYVTSPAVHMPTTEFIPPSSGRLFASISHASSRQLERSRSIFSKFVLWQDQRAKTLLSFKNICLNGMKRMEENFHGAKGV